MAAHAPPPNSTSNPPSKPTSTPSSTSTPTSTPLSLTATYKSPSNAPFNYSTTLPPLSQPAKTTRQKTAFLTSLRLASVQLQEDINRELTARMEEDRRLAAEAESHMGGGKGKGGVKKKRDEEIEEENYGEELVDEEG